MTYVREFYYILLFLFFYFAGGAINQAKGALTNWWSNFTTNQVTGTGVDDAEFASEDLENTGTSLEHGQNSVHLSTE